MVCPVTEPMYYGENSAELTDTVKTRRVYLPEAYGWYDYWTNTYYEGDSGLKSVHLLTEYHYLSKKEGSS